jgi:pyruvate formate lyase activating enzyme
MGGRLYDLEPPEDPSLREAMWYRRSGDKRAFCELCFRGCIIPEGQRGFCRVRENRGGRLYSLVYGKTVSWQIMPIEKDTMYHLLPNAGVFALATASCNFRCKQCHNWQISQRGPEELRSLDWPPDEIVRRATENRCIFISCTMNEPTVFYEYMLDIAKLAKERGLLTLFRSNGAMRPEPLRELLKYMDGVSLDLKGFSADFYREILSAELEPVLETLKVLKEDGVLFEITNLVIPTLNDNFEDIRRMCIWIKENLGKETFLHFNRFFPAYKLTHLPPTPIETLEMAREIAVEVGLDYVYIGNAPGHKYNSTFCPRCGEMVIHRIHFVVIGINLVGGRCKFCGHEIPGIWWRW